MPIDPTFSVGGPEWQIGIGSSDATTPTSPTPATDAAQPSGGGFGDLLGSSIKSLTESQESAATAAQQLATGQASDPTAVVMAVERAQLAMQLASQIRTKAVEAAQDIFHTQV
jgi:flagellar hook-basal body complex protein FliE